MFITGNNFQVQLMFLVGLCYVLYNKPLSLYPKNINKLSLVCLFSIIRGNQAAIKILLNCFLVHEAHLETLIKNYSSLAMLKKNLC